MSRPRLFDVAREEPDLGLDRASRRRPPPQEAADRRAAGPPPGPPRPPAKERRRRRASGSEPPAGRPSPRRAVPSEVAVDPRIAARRARVEADEADATARRRRRRAIVTVVVLAIAVAAAGALLSPLFSVSTIEVAGARRTAAAEVRRASSLDGRPPMARLDQAQVEAAIEALPWVERARVERRWPRTVVVTVEERRPVAVAPCQDATTCLVDASGRVLAAASADREAAATLPRIGGVPPAGPPGSAVADVVRGPLAVAVALPEAIRPLVSEVRGDGGEVSLQLHSTGREKSPPVVRLGPADRIDEKLTAAATVLARTSVNGVDVLDVRVPESPALTRLRR